MNGAFKSTFPVTAVIGKVEWSRGTTDVSASPTEHDLFACAPSLATASCSDCLRLCFSIGGFESQIDGPAAQWTSTVTKTARNCCHLTWGELDFTVLKFHDKPASHNNKFFV